MLHSPAFLYPSLLLHLTLFLLASSGIGSQGKGSGQNLRGSQQLYQHHQYANYNNNNTSSGRLSANGGQTAYTTSNSWSPGAGNYLQQQQQGENYQQPGQQTSRGFLGSSSSSSGRNQQPQQTLSPTSRRENLSHLDNSRSYLFTRKSPLLDTDKMVTILRAMVDAGGQQRSQPSSTTAPRY